MGYHPRFETTEAGSFLTTRCRNSELWLNASSELERATLGYAAKYAERYKVTLYGIAIEGNHIQSPAHFPGLNRAHFMRDLNSSISRALPRYVRSYPGGRLWGRRFSSELTPFEDIEKEFFYTVLQPVQDGLVEKLSEYPFYNCFHDAVWDVRRRYKVVRWGDYNEARKNGTHVRISDYTEIVSLKFARVPGYEHLSQKAYAHLMQAKLEEKRVEIVKKRYSDGLGFMGRERLLAVVPGSLPGNTKTSSIDSHRPRVLSACPVRHRFWTNWYFGNYYQYKEASREYRAGNLNVRFPEGTYKPPILSPAPKPKDYS